jgi:Fe-S oxidoreductase
MIFDPFVLPFTIGLSFLIILVLYKCTVWIRHLPREERRKIRKGFVSRKPLYACKEIIMESLLHRKIFRVNPRLGFMHMSLAFGWFMLILVGNIETRIHSGRELNGPFYPIFFKFFEHNRAGIPFNNFFVFIMDFLLLFVIIGVVLAIFKRIRSQFFGMRSTTKLKIGDKFALYSLWFIFPLRFLAESLSSAVFHTGGFFTGTAGKLLGSFLPAADIYYYAWWAYSLALGMFFSALPFSRYMHIPTEVFLIFLRQFGVKPTKGNKVLSQVEINACPRCGICIDKCQLNTSLENRKIQPAYFLRDIRYNIIKEETAQDCMLCGRCEEYCPVGINLNNIRVSRRREMAVDHTDNYPYLSQNGIQQTEVIYFAGCMTHLTPSIKFAMKKILETAKLKYWFMDEDGSVCCGRPLMMSGKDKMAAELIKNNKNKIKISGAKLFVTSCPICLKVFKEEYELGIEVMHHSQYMLQLVKERKLELQLSGNDIVYHDPCELGRGGGIYEEPRELLKMIGNVHSNGYERENALCCGGSLGNVIMTHEQRDKVAADVIEQLTISKPDLLATACPLCKKTFAYKSDTKVMDIAEIVAAVLSPSVNKTSNEQKKLGVTADCNQ